MAKKSGAIGRADLPVGHDARQRVPTKQRPSALVDTRVIYCGDNLEQLQNLPDACIDLIYIDPPINSNRNHEVFWGSPREITPRVTTPHCLNRISRGETKEKRAFEDRHASIAKGFFVAFDYSDDALREIDRCFKPDHAVIIQLTVKEILDEQIARKLV